MESTDANEHIPSNESRDVDIKESITQVANMYIQAAEQYLDEHDSLRDRIVNYYSNRAETQQELQHFLEKKDEEGISTYLQAVEMFTHDPTRFIEQMEKLYELSDTRTRRRKLATEDRIASEEEYKLGAYVDVLESQVRDAVLAAQRKGYRTFQSGFTEKSERGQFMDFYNKNIEVPQQFLEYLRGLSIEARIENFKDRTTLTLHPIGPKPIRLAQWKEIWDIVIASLPQADGKMVENIKTTGEHRVFRKNQDSLRNKSD
jgi:vacuolar-type H+-ATPase subunit I/STV1